MWYPFGAVENQKALETLIGKPVYMVYGLGRDSCLVDMGTARKIEKRETPYFVGSQKEYVKTNFVLLTSGPEGEDHVYLGDVNIGSNHNNHYLFHEHEDAEAYLEWAIVNTKDIDRGDLWDLEWDPFCR